MSMSPAAILTVDAEYQPNLKNIVSNVEGLLSQAEAAAGKHKIKVDIDQAHLQQQVSAMMNTINSVGNIAGGVAGKGKVGGGSGKANAKKAASNAAKQYTSAMKMYRSEVLKAQKANMDVALYEDGRTLTGTRWRANDKNNKDAVAQAKYLNTLAKNTELRRRGLEKEGDLNNAIIVQEKQKLDAIEARSRTTAAAKAEKSAIAEQARADKAAFTEQKKVINDWWKYRTETEKNYSRGKTDVLYDKNAGSLVGTSEETLKRGIQLQKEYDDVMRTSGERSADLAKINADAQSKHLMEMEKIVPSQAKIQDTIAKTQKFLDNAEAAKYGETAGNRAAIEEDVKALKNLNDQYGEMNPGKIANDFKQITGAIEENKGAIVDAGEVTASFGGKIGAAIKKYAQYFGVSRAIMAAVRSVKMMASASIEVESAMNRIQIVTGASESEMSSFYESASKQAQELGKSITDVASSIETFSRLGYNLQDASELSKYATIMSNVADTDVASATTGITSIIKGYSLDASDVEHVSDVLVNVGRKYAISAEELMMAFERGGAALSASGTDFEKSAALFAATNASLQNAQTTGTMWKTVSARIRGAKTELEEMGEDTSDLAEGFSKNRDELKALTGVDIMKNKDEYKDLYTIFTELAHVWDNINGDAAKARVAEILGGTRQLSGIMSTINNIADAEGAYAAAMDSAGVSMEANDKHMETTEAHIGQLKATFQDFSSDFLQSSFLKGLVDTGNKALTVIDSLMDKIGVMGTIIAGASFAKALPALKEASTYLNMMIFGGGAGGIAGHKQKAKMVDAFKSLIPTLKALIPLAAAFTAYKIFDYANSGWTRAQESAKNAVQEFDEAQSKLDSLKDDQAGKLSEAQEIAAKYNIDVEGIDDVDSVIDKIRSSDSGIKLVDDAELSKISSANKSLEANLAIQEQIAEAKRQAAFSETKNAAETEKSYWESLKEEYGVPKAIVKYLGSGARYGGSYYGGNITYENDKAEYDKRDTTNIGLAEAAVKKLREQKKELNELSEELSNIRENGGEATKEQTDRFNKLSQSITESSSEAAKYVEIVSDEMTNLEGDTSDFAAQRRLRANELFKDYRQIDMSDEERSLDNITTFFEKYPNLLDRFKKANKGYKKEVSDATTRVDALSDVMDSLGLSLSDIGIDDISTLEDYLWGATDAADNASNSVSNFVKRVSDIEDASESVNQDKSWSTVQEAYETAKEMLKQGKTGTDDFQTMAQFLSPKNIEKAAKQMVKNGGYAADAYQKAFESAKATADRWFGEDETKSMENFVKDFQSKGLFDVTTDKMGLWDIATKFDTTAEAAEKMGTSVYAVETMLDALRAYGYDFDTNDRQIEYSGKLLDDYKTNLEALKGVYDSLEDGYAKDHFKSIIEGFEGEYDKFSEDLSQLSEDQIVQIKFEYDLAELQSNIDKAKRAAYYSPDDVGTQADLVAAQGAYLDKAEDKLGFNREGVKIPVEYTASVQNEQDLLAKLKTATPEEKLQIYAEIANEQQMRQELLDKFSETHPEITAESNVDEVNAAIESFMSEDGKEIIVKAQAIGEQDVNALHTSITNVNSRDVQVTAHVSGQEKVSSLGDAIRGIGSKTVDIVTNYIENHVKNKGKGNTRSTGEQQVNGTAHFSGTAFARGTHGNWGTRGSGTALGGELGEELLVRDGRWYSIGRNGAEFFNYKKDDIIFNADQTRQLFEKGKIQYGKRRGSALYDGTAFRYGTAGSGPAFRLGGNTGGSGSGKGKSGGGSGGNSKDKNKTDKKLEAFKKWLAKLFDWVEVRLSRGAKLIEKYTDRAERAAAAGRAGTAESYYNKAINASKTQMKNATLGRTVYDRQAEKVLKKAIKGKILTKKQAASIRKRDASGTLVISEYSERLQEIVKAYQTWKDKSRDASDTIRELSASITDSYKKIAEAYRDSAESQISLFKQKSGNASSASSKNSNLEKIAEQYDKIVKSDEDAINGLDNIVKSSGDAVKNAKKVTSTAKHRRLSKKSKSTVTKCVNSAKKYAKNGKAIPSGVMNKLQTYYQKGYIKGSFYSACVRYNQLRSYSYDAKQELNAQLDIDKETATQEKIAIGEEMVKNVEDEYNRKLDTIKGYQGVKTTAGYEMKASDYQSLYDTLEAQKDAISAAIDRNLELKYWNENTPEYIDALNNLKEIETAMQENINAIAEIPYSTIEKALELIDAIASYNESVSELKTAEGEDLLKEDYMQQIEDNTKKIELYEEQAALAYEDLARAVANGGYYAGKTANEYEVMYNEALTNANNARVANEDLKDSMRDDVYWRDLERAHDAAQRLQNIVSGLADLISDDMYYKNGKLTKFGIAQIANLVKEYELARKEVTNYSNDIDNLNTLYSNGEYTAEEYKEKLADLQDGLLGAAKNMKDYIDDIVSMYKDLDQNELDALFKLIDARNDALSAKKEYYDYDKTIRSKTKDIQELTAQIAALEGIDTAEAKAQRAKLQEQLFEAQEDLKDTEQDHYIDIMQDGLSDLKDALQNEFDEKWENLSGDLDKMLELLSAANVLSTENADNIRQTLTDLLSFYGIDAGATKVDAAFASGTRRVNGRKVALSNESGSEILVTKNGIISHFNPGDGVVPADLTARLYDLAQSIKPGSSLGKANLKGVSANSGLSVTQNYGSLINIEGSADAATVSDLKRMSKDLLEKSYNYTSQRIQHDYRRTGGLRRA